MKDIKAGDMCTIQGIYEPRTFWQFITMRPRKLKQFKAMSMYVHGVGIDCH